MLYKFQRLMYEVLNGREFCYIYINYIVTASTNFEEHTEHLEILFSRLKFYGLTINIANLEKVNYLS